MFPELTAKYGPRTPTLPDPDSRHVLAADCRRCPELADARERVSWGNGPLDAGVVVVGEVPVAGDSDAE